MSLTRHKEGSLRELWAIAYPLMLWSLSVMTMVFFDRWFLAHYSIEAHNAAVAATTLGWAFVFGGTTLAVTAEIFVAQYNGAGLRHRLGEPVWQMIWFAVMSFLFFLTIVCLGNGISLRNRPRLCLGTRLFLCMVLFGPFHCLNGALSSFFIGQGKTRLITILAIAANLFNVIFDAILIFGIEGWVPSLGIKGAAIATSLAVVFQCVILGNIFLKKKNREECGTSCWQLQPKALKECLAVGFPMALFIAAEILAFAVYYGLMKEMGTTYITIAGICQSMLILFLFFADGMNKAIATIAGNMIGAKRSHLVFKVIRSGFILTSLFFVVLLFVFIFGMPLIIDQFLPDASPAFIDDIEESLRTCLILIAFYLFFDVVRGLFSGVLSAAGDTVFLLVAGSLSVWFMMIVPVYFFVVVGHASIEVAIAIETLYSLGISLIYMVRVQQGGWRSLSISSNLRTEQNLRTIETSEIRES